MINSYLIYDTTGRILRTVIASPSLAELQPISSERMIMGEGSALTYYIKDETITSRPDMLAQFNRTEVIADSTDTIAVTNLPDPCIITYTGPGFEITEEATGGTAEFTTDVAGTHTVKVVAFPYLDWEGTFDAI